MNKELIRGYIELSKPRILTLILVTTALGYFWAWKAFRVDATFWFTLTGAASVCAGAGALNHYLERDADRKMTRTKNRPLPQGIIRPQQALSYGILLILFGVILLYVKVNLLTAFLSLLTAFLYILVYTPLKKLSWLNTSIGAIPGSIPPLGGWAAATGHLDTNAWILFFIPFLWQHPHFFAIAWIFREDYKRAGFKMLPVLEADGRWTFVNIFAATALLIPVSMLPTFVGMSGPVYATGALTLGLTMLFISKNFYDAKSTLEAHYLLRASVIYLPVLLLLILVDASF